VAPIQVGKPPGDELSGFLTTRAARQRYRIIYKVNQDQEHVIVYLVGIRKEGSPEDVYRIAVRLQARGFI